MNSDIHQLLHAHWGYQGFRQKQEEVIRSVMAGNDTLALLPTGAGKTLCYQVPILAMGGLCVVISPLIALMKDQVARARKHGLKAAAVMSGMTQREVENTLEDAALGRLSLLYMAPERIGTEMFQGRLPRMPLSLIAVDEAHCISQWGYDFRPAYQRIASLREAFPNVPVLALTATATTRVLEDIEEHLAFRTSNRIRSSFVRPELTFWVSKGEDKMDKLARVVRRSTGTGIIYVDQRKATVRLADHLKHLGAKAHAYHAGMTYTDRDRVQQEWMNGNDHWVVATNAFGMGIDKSDVRTVLHMVPPSDPESYYQEAGRAGRDGKDAYAIMLCSATDPQLLHDRVLMGFPSLAVVRAVYQAFANIHRIAVGSGHEGTYAYDIRELAIKASVTPAQVVHSMKALELDGRITLSDGAREPSRLQMIGDPREIQRQHREARPLGPLLETTLRLYGGMFESPVIIDEERIARIMGTTPQEVVDGMNGSHRAGLVRFSPRSDLPILTLMEPRVDAATLRLDPRSLAQRKERALQRLQVMLDNVSGDVQCRQRFLLDYFDEPPTGPCGKCDRCVATNRSAVDHPALPLLQDDIRRERWHRDQAKLNTIDTEE